MAFPTRIMTLGKFYEMVEQNTSGNTPVSLFQPDYPGYFVDPSTPIRITVKRTGIISPLVCLVFNIDQKRGRPVSRERLLNVLADIAECYSWNMKMGIAIPCVGTKNARHARQEPFIYNMHGDWNMWPGLDRPNAFQLSCSVEPEYEQVPQREVSRQLSLTYYAAFA